MTVYPRTVAALLYPKAMRHFLTACALALLCCALACRRAAAPPRELRLISLTPSATELVAALGLTDRLVGVDEYSTYPPQVSGLTKVGSFLTPSLEAIVALRPSHVLADDIHKDLGAALRDAGIATVIMPMHSLADVRNALTTLGRELGQRPRAEEVLRELDARVEAAAAARLRPAPRVLVVLDRAAGGLTGLVCAATGSWIDQLLALLGADNVLAASGVRYPKVTLEELLRADPDVILDLSFVEDGGAAWRGAALRAVTANRVHALRQPFLLSPSPRVPEALATLRAALVPATAPAAAR